MATRQFSSLPACWLLLLLLGVALPGARGASWSKANTFCHMAAATESSRDSRFLSFLWRRPGGGGPASVLLLVQSAWDAQGHLLDCVWQREPAITSLYRQVCAQQAAKDARRGPLARVFWGPALQRDLHALEQGGKDACWRAPAPGEEAPARRRRAKRALAGGRPGSPEEEEAARGRKRVRRGWTMPGTLWCGAGDSAGNASELGVFQGPDVCCREHDQCEGQIAALGYNYGMRNYRLHTISHCDCDTRFKQCLLDLNDTISNLIGISFFNLLEIPCFVLEESEECLEWHWWSGCKRYGLMPLARLVEQSQYHYDLPLNERADLTTPSPHPERRRGKNRKHSRKNHWNQKRLGLVAAEVHKPIPDQADSQSVVARQRPVSKPGLNSPSQLPESPRSALVTGEKRPLQSNVEATLELGLHTGVIPTVEPSAVPRSHAEAAALPDEVMQSGKPISGHAAMPGGAAPAQSCNCYRRMDQCQYRIAPNEVKFQLHNVDSRTLFHCNCTRRLARFLRRTKGPNEVEGEVLSNYISSACFVLQTPPGCMEGEEGHPNCIDVGKAVLAPARHLTNRLTRNFRSASVKVKRQDRMPQDRPVQLYDKCIQLAQAVHHAVPH